MKEYVFVVLATAQTIKTVFHSLSSIRRPPLLKLNSALYNTKEEDADYHFKRNSLKM